MKRHHRRNSIITCVLIILICVSSNIISTPYTKTAYASSPSYSTRNITVGGVTTNFSYVRIDLADPSVSFRAITANNRVPQAYSSGRALALWSDNQNHTQPLIDMYNAYGGVNRIAAINTDYFSTSTSPPGKQGAPEGEFIRNGVRYQWRENRAVMRIFDWNGPRYPVTFAVSSSAATSARTGVGGSPIIRIVNNSVQWNPSSEQTEVPRTVSTRTARSAACTTSDGRTLYLLAGLDTTGTHVGEFFKSVGCTRGMEFDGGGSPTLIYGGQVRLTATNRFIGTGLAVRYDPAWTTPPCPTNTDP